MSGLEVRELALEAGGVLAEAWERLVQRQPESGFMQALAWAAFKRRQGLRVLHLGVFDAGVLVAGALAYGAPRPGSIGILVSPDGPVMPWEDEARTAACMKALHAGFRERFSGEGAIAWRIEPRLPRPAPRILRNFTRAPVDLLPCESLYLDLAPTPDQLLAGMRPKGRYNIRLAPRRGVVVEEAGPEGLDALYDILQQAAGRDGFFLEPREFFAQLLEAPGSFVRLLLARGCETQGNHLGALVLVTYGGRATYLYGGVANHGRERMAGYALQWAAITRARELGCRTYDFYGFDPFERPGHLYARFSRFKRQFGGRPVRFIGAHEHLATDRVADAVVRAVQEIGWS